MEPQTHENKWYAVYTKPKWEKKIAQLLTRRQIENYCPLNRVVRQWHDRKKIVHEPLFSCYVFVRTTERMLSEIRRIHGILNFVYWLNKPAIVRNDEIEAIRGFLVEHQNVRVEKRTLSVNDVVKVTAGPLMQYEGNVIAIKNKTIKILLPSLGYMMVAEVEKKNVKIVNKADRFGQDKDERGRKRVNGR